MNATATTSRSPQLNITDPEQIRGRLDALRGKDVIFSDQTAICTRGTLDEVTLDGKYLTAKINRAAVGEVADYHEVIFATDHVRLMGSDHFADTSTGKIYDLAVGNRFAGYLRVKSVPSAEPAQR